MRKRKISSYIFIKSPIAVISITLLSTVLVLMLLFNITVPVYYKKTVPVKDSYVQVTIDKNPGYYIHLKSNVFYYSENSVERSKKIKISNINENVEEYKLSMFCEKKNLNGEITIEVEVGKQKLIHRLFED